MWKQAFVNARNKLTAQLFQPAEPTLSEREFHLILKARRLTDRMSRYWFFRGQNWTWATPMLLSFALTPVMMFFIWPKAIAGTLTPQEFSAFFEAILVYVMTYVGFPVLFAIALLMSAVKFFLEPFAQTKIHDRYEPPLQELAQAGNPDAAFEMARRAERRGADVARQMA